MKINVRHDVNKLIRQNEDLKEQLLKAAASAVNETATKVRTAAIEDIAGRNTGYTKATIRGYVTLRKAKYTKPRLTKAGALRVNYAGLAATITAAGKAPNLIYFVSPSSRTPLAFRNLPGVLASVQGKANSFDGTFIVRTKGGKMVVVSRSAKAKRSPQVMRPRGNHGKWLKGWSKGIYGPPLQSLAGDEHTFTVMRTTALQQWPAAWAKYSAVVLETAR